MRAGRLPVAIGIVGSLFLLVATSLAVRDWDFHGHTAYRRLWSDLAQGVSRYLELARPPARVKPPNERADERVRAQVLAWIRVGGLHPGQALRSMPDEAFLFPRLRAAPKPYDDRGRGELLGWAFWLRGGVSPFFIVWLGPVLAIPLMVWGIVELWDAGAHRAAAAWALGLPLVPFVPETLALTRYAVGFYLIGVLTIVPLAVYAVANRRPTLRGLLTRTLLAAFALGVCVWCRSSAQLLIAGLGLALVLGLRRTMKDPWHRYGLALIGLGLLVLPVPLASRAQQNDVWQPLWEGLGDFDREKGYTWDDRVAEAAARQRGAAGLWTARSEAIFRSDILFDLRDDPGWYAGILARRLLSTLSLYKLWPWLPLDGAFLRTAASANEGVMDKYWTYSTTIDHVGLGRRRAELPIPVLVMPLLAVMVWAARGSRVARAGLLVVACLAAGTLVLPVLVTTAGGTEAQSFALSYVFGAAWLTEILPGRRAEGAQTPEPT